MFKFLKINSLGVQVRGASSLQLLAPSLQQKNIKKMIVIDKKMYLCIVE